MSKSNISNEAPIEDVMRLSKKEQSKRLDGQTPGESDSDEDNVKLLKDILKKRDVRGRRAGGRFWKEERKRLLLSSVDSTLKQKQKRIAHSIKLRKEIKEARDLSRTALDAKTEAKRLRRERREENLKNREKNAKKAEIVQVITNTAKLKKIKNKNYLRSIEKRDTSGMV